MELSFWKSQEVQKLGLMDLDVLDVASIESLSENILLQGCRIAGIACTIGKALTKPLQTMKPVDYMDLLDLNTISFFELVKQLSKRNLIHPEGASVVVISSLVGDQGAKGKIAYSASKGALNAAVRSLALELAPRGIRVNAVSPGTVRTDMLDRLINTIGAEEVAKLEEEFPLGLGYPDDVADLAVFLLSDAARWITGTTITIDGGFGAR